MVKISRIILCIFALGAPCMSASEKRTDVEYKIDASLLEQDSLDVDDRTLCGKKLHCKEHIRDQLRYDQDRDMRLAARKPEDIVKSLTLQKRVAQKIKAKECGKDVAVKSLIKTTIGCKKLPDDLADNVMSYLQEMQCLQNCFLQGDGTAVALSTDGKYAFTGFIIY